MQLKIYCWGDPVLRKHCIPVEEITPEIRQLAMDMIETADVNDGIGLSAPQVGYSLRLFVLRNYLFGEDGKWSLSEPQVFINPKLSHPGTKLLLEEEGCLSFPKLRLPIYRPDRITIEALDINGHPFKEEVEGYNARVRMHENDHINGVLFIDRIDAKMRKKINPLLQHIKKNCTI